MVKKMKADYIKNFTKKSVLVIGDCMLDKYLYGQVTRISPEAPVPVVKIVSQDYILGGACNSANNIASFGATVYLAGVVGNDDQGKILEETLKKKNIKSLIVKDPSRPTTIKERIIAGNNYQLLRIDHEKTSPLSEEIGKKVFELIKEKIKTIDGILISDYAKGVISEKLIKSIIKLANENKKIITIDGKPQHVSFFKGCSLLTPNLKEASEMTGIEQDIIMMGNKLVKLLDSNIFITRGSEGISIFDKNLKHTHIPSLKATKIIDVTGAGDTVIAVATLALCSGMSLIEAAELSNYAAGLVVQKPGTATITQEELESTYQSEISHYLTESIEVKQKVIAEQVGKIEKAAEMFINAYKKGNKIISFGNGGSASDAQHLVGELVGRFKIERRALPAIALTNDSSVVTAIANDYGFEHVFERQLEAIASKGDVVVGISTSGDSPNVINAIKKAKELGCKTLGLTGKEGGQLVSLCDVAIVVPSFNTPRIQETHIAIIHILCELLDKQLKNE